VGGTGNSLYSYYHYSVKDDLNFTATRTSHINVGLANLLRKHKPWMNRKVRSVNVQLNRALLEHGTSHIGVIDTTTIVREDYMNHCLHLKWQGKGKLTLLFAEKLGDDHVSGISSISVITHATASPFID
jgi:hypothetical protein